MGVIFYFSSRTAIESSGQSGFFVELFKRLFGDNGITDFIVRKTAHCLEFTGLALLFNIALYVQTDKIKPYLAIIFTSLYAVTDEVHQIFVEGRACQLMDWGIDTIGAILGTIGFLVIYFAIIQIKKRKTS